MPPRLRQGDKSWGLEEREEVDTCVDWGTTGSQVHLVRVSSWPTHELDSRGHQSHLKLAVTEQRWEGGTQGRREGECPVTSTTKPY